ncbi:MAG: CTP-dependent riboflavin kinase [Deltaproteobacteria bacterium]|nr:MAG: CTP-dependent riboflavin kinase [Deltaproteobacteria bacterium]
MKRSPSRNVVIKGTLVEGIKESGLFMSIPWVREQFIEKLGVDPYPGTLNLEIKDSQDLDKLTELKSRAGIDILPMDPGFCSAKCFHVLICGKVKGAIVIPLIDDYPESKLEIIASERLKDLLSLKVGDIVLIEIDLGNRSERNGVRSSRKTAGKPTLVTTW